MKKEVLGEKKQFLSLKKWTPSELKEIDSK